MQILVEVLANHGDIAQQLAHALQGVILALNRDDDLFSARHGVDGEQTQRWRAINEDIFKAMLFKEAIMQGVIEPKFTAYQGDHFNLRAS